MDDYDRKKRSFLKPNKQDIRRLRLEKFEKEEKQKK